MLLALESPRLGVGMNDDIGVCVNESVADNVITPVEVMETDLLTLTDLLIQILDDAQPDELGEPLSVG